MRASEILRELRERKGHGAFAIAQCSQMHMQLAAAWLSVKVPADPNPDEECPPDTPPQAQGRWLWARLEPDPVPAWIEVAGLPDAPHVRRVCRVLQDNAVVLPDGTLSDAMTTFLELKYNFAIGALIPKDGGDG